MKFDEILDGILNLFYRWYDEGYILIGSIFLGIIILVIFLIFLFSNLVQKEDKRDPKLIQLEQEANLFCIEKGFDDWLLLNETNLSFTCIYRENNNFNVSLYYLNHS